MNSRWEVTMLSTLAIRFVVSIHAAAMASQPALPDRLPQHKWAVGQELGYENKLESRYEHGSHRMRIEDHFWCTRKNADNSYRFIVHETWYEMPESGPADANAKPTRSLLHLMDRRSDGGWSWPMQAPPFTMATNVTL